MAFTNDNYLLDLNYLPKNLTFLKINNSILSIDWNILPKSLKMIEIPQNISKSFSITNMPAKSNIIIMMNVNEFETNIFVPDVITIIKISPSYIYTSKPNSIYFQNINPNIEIFLEWIKNIPLSNLPVQLTILQFNEIFNQSIDNLYMEEIRFFLDDFIFMLIKENELIQKIHSNKINHFTLLNKEPNNPTFSKYDVVFNGFDLIFDQNLIIYNFKIKLSTLDIIFENIIQLIEEISNHKINNYKINLEIKYKLYHMYKTPMFKEICEINHLDLTKNPDIMFVSNIEEFILGQYDDMISKKYINKYKKYINIITFTHL